MVESNPSGGMTTRARQKIRGILAERDMTIGELGLKVGWSRSTASRKLGRVRDTAPLTISDVEAVATVLEIPVSQILPAEAVAA